VKELHRRADALAALLLHQKCGDARVHTTAHRNEYLIHSSSHHAARFHAEIFYDGSDAAFIILPYFAVLL